jgi:PAS domain S-box-containing protein
MPAEAGPTGWTEAVVESSPHAIVATDVEGLVRLWNPAAERLYGWTAEEMVGRNVVDVLAPEPLASEAKSIMAVIESAGAWTGTFSVRHKDGTVVRAVVSNRRIVRHDGTPVGVVGESRVLDDKGDRGENTGERPESLLLWLDDVLGEGALGDGALGEGPGDTATGQGRADGARATTEAALPQVEAAAQAPLLAAEHSARVAAEMAAARLAGLQAVTAALSRALDRSEVADAVFHHGLRHLGGSTGSLCLVAPGGTTVDIVHAMGYSDMVTESWHSFPLDAALPASEAIRTGELVLLRSSAEMQSRFALPSGAPLVGDQAHAILPLPDEDGAPFGALVVGFAQARDFSDDDVALLRALATQCAGALRRAQMFETIRAAADAEQAARRAAEEAHDDLAFMAEASSALSSSLDYERTVTSAVELAVPRLADWCAVFLPADDGRIRPLALAHADPDRVALVRRLLERFPPDPDAPSSIGAVIRTGRREVTREIDDGLLDQTIDDPERRALVREVGLGSIAILPLPAGGRVLGAIVLANHRGRQLSDRSVALGADLAMRAGVAIDNALLFADRVRIARQLQASLLPGALPTIPGLEVGARYAAAGGSDEVGGDFYDVFALDGDRWAVVVGDVRGKGVEAAAVTGLARHTIRSASLHMTSPRALLAHLNEVLLRTEADRRRSGPGPAAADDGGTDAIRAAWALDEPRFCTVGLAVVEPSPDGANVVVCSGGHPLPLVARADGRVETVGRAGTLLGVGRDVDLQDVAVDLGPGDSLVSFTDGIVERHQGRRFFEAEGVAAVLQASAGLPADAVAAAVEDAACRFVERAPSDDMAVVVVRVPTPAGGPLAGTGG